MSDADMVVFYRKEAGRWRQTARQLAEDIQTLARDGGMPDSFRLTDQRMLRATKVLEENEATEVVTDDEV